MGIKATPQKQPPGFVHGLTIRNKHLSVRVCARSSLVVWLKKRFLATLKSFQIRERELFWCREEQLSRFSSHNSSASNERKKKKKIGTGLERTENRDENKIHGWWLNGSSVDVWLIAGMRSCHYNRCHGEPGNEAATKTELRLLPKSGHAFSLRKIKKRKCRESLVEG